MELLKHRRTYRDEVYNLIGNPTIIGNFEHDGKSIEIALHNLIPKSIYCDMEFKGYFDSIESDMVEEKYRYTFNVDDNSVFLPMSNEDCRLFGVTKYGSGNVFYEWFCGQKIREIVRRGEDVFNREILRLSVCNKGNASQDELIYAASKIKCNFMAREHKGFQCFLYMGLQEEGIEEANLPKNDILLPLSENDFRVKSSSFSMCEYYKSLNDRWTMEKISGSLFSFEPGDHHNCSSAYTGVLAFRAGSNSQHLRNDKLYMDSKEYHIKKFINNSSDKCNIDKIYVGVSGGNIKCDIGLSEVVGSNISFINHVEKITFSKDSFHKDAIRSYYVDYYLTQLCDGGFSQFFANSNLHGFILQNVYEGLVGMGLEKHAELFVTQYKILKEYGSERLEKFLDEMHVKLNWKNDVAIALDEKNNLFFSLNEDFPIEEANAKWLKNHPDLVVLNRDEWDYAITTFTRYL
ncbi:DMP19 family protein [Enterovibrio norvegicus]|uniref:DMP19 family protein n=1 Tax=Enterovibrio norvegicus TaxID=188144 RepID=UPI00354AE633